MVEKLLRKLGHFKGKQRIARWLLRKKISISRDVLVEGKYGCSYLLPNIAENIGFEIFIDGVYEEDHLKLILEKMPPDGVFVDIGANIGTIAIPVGKLRPDVTILCVEAAARIFYYLKKNVELNAISNLNLFNNAMAEVNDTEVKFYSPDIKYGKGSMSNVFTNQAESVKTITLDKLIGNYNPAKVSLLKVDVEGFECSVFKGGSQLLSGDKAPDILFEFVDWAEQSSGLYQPGDAQAYLFSMGYRLFILKKGEMLPLTEPMKKGYGMIYATKKS